MEFHILINIDCVYARLDPVERRAGVNNYLP